MIDYDSYIKECFEHEDIFGSDPIYGRRKRHERNRKIIPVSKRRFDRTKEDIQNIINKNQYTDINTAKEDVEIQIQQMAPVIFFLLKIFIGWLIGKMLDNYFGNKSNKAI